MHHAKYFGTRFYNGIGTLLLPSEIRNCPRRFTHCSICVCEHLAIVLCVCVFIFTIYHLRGYLKFVSSTPLTPRSVKSADDPSSQISQD